MSNWQKVPDDWEPLDKKAAKQKNIATLTAAKIVEVREMPDGSLQWRRAPRP